MCVCVVDADPRRGHVLYIYVHFDSFLITFIIKKSEKAIGTEI